MLYARLVVAVALMSAAGCSAADSSPVAIPTEIGQLTPQDVSVSITVGSSEPRPVQVLTGPPLGATYTVECQATADCAADEFCNLTEGHCSLSEECSDSGQCPADWFCNANKVCEPAS
jgi:hypothetical protein